MKNTQFVALLSVVVGIGIITFFTTNSNTEEYDTTIAENILRQVNIVVHDSEKANVVYTHYDQPDITSQEKEVYDLPPGTLSLDRYEFYSKDHNHEEENVRIKIFEILFVNGIGQINPQDPGFGGVDITKGFVLQNNVIARLYPLDKTTTDSLKVLLLNKKTL